MARLSSRAGSGRPGSEALASDGLGSPLELGSDVDLGSATAAWSSPLPAEVDFVGRES